MRKILNFLEKKFFLKITCDTYKANPKSPPIVFPHKAEFFLIDVRGKKFLKQFFFLKKILRTRRMEFCNAAGFFSRGLSFLVIFGMCGKKLSFLQTFLHKLFTGVGWNQFDNLLEKAPRKSRKISLNDRHEKKSFLKNSQSCSSIHSHR